jgi:hypothetical protein
MASAELATDAGFLFAHDPYRKTAVHFSGIMRLHAVTFEHPAASLAEPRPVRLQAVLNRTVIAEILPAKALGVTRTGPPFLRGSLRHCDGNAREGNCNSQSQSDHHNLILTMQRGGLNRPRSVAVRTRAGADSSVIRMSATGVIVRLVRNCALRRTIQYPRGVSARALPSPECQVVAEEG